MPLEDDAPDEWAEEIRAAVTAAVAPLFTESGTRRVSKMLRDDTGRWMKRRSRTPIHATKWAEERARRIPVPVYDLTRTPLSGLPADVYERLHELVGDHGKPTGWVDDTIEAIRRVKDRPDALVDVYSAAPRDIRNIHPKDWISLAPGFARTRAEAYPGWHLLRATVPAAEVLTRSEDLMRWTWAGASPVRQSEQISSRGKIPNR